MSEEFDQQFGQQIVKAIENKSYLKAINLLTVFINNGLNGNAFVDAFDYLLMRAYCYYRFSKAAQEVKEAMDLALADVWSANQLSAHRFQSYLLGAFVLSDLKRYSESLTMFEKCIQLNDKLFDVLINRLNYLKFKVLTERGFDEELSLKTAIECRYLEECVDRLSEHKSDFELDIFTLIFSDQLASSGQLARSGSSASRMRSFSEVVSSNDEDYAKGDQQLIDTNDTNSVFIDHLVNESLKSPPICSTRDLETESIGSLDLEFKDTLNANDSMIIQKLETSDEWIETNHNSDNVSKMCSFDVESNGAKNTSIMNYKRKIGHKFGTHSSNNLKQTPTNLFKLRGLYVGNLKNSCDQKAIREEFNIYGQIMDFYQPLGESYAFIHFKAHDSATNLLKDWNHRPHSQCKDDKNLVIRFTASQDQMGKYNSITHLEYKKRCNEAQECDLWRSGQRCPLDFKCPMTHIPVCRSVDTLPDKRKAKWKLM